MTFQLENALKIFSVLFVNFVRTIKKNVWYFKLSNRRNVKKNRCKDLLENFVGAFPSNRMNRFILIMLPWYLKMENLDL